MSRAVWKFPLPIPYAGPPIIELDLPRDAQVLHVGQQADVPTMWALVEENMLGRESRSFLLAPTGGGLPDGQLDHLGTCHIVAGAVVVHVFEMADLRHPHAA